MILDERVRRAGTRLERVERNLRVPEQLRARVDEMTPAARRRRSARDAVVSSSRVRLRRVGQRARRRD